MTINLFISKNKKCQFDFGSAMFSHMLHNCLIVLDQWMNILQCEREKNAPCPLPFNRVTFSFESHLPSTFFPPHTVLKSAWLHDIPDPKVAYLIFHGLISVLGAPNLSPTDPKKLSRCEWVSRKEGLISILGHPVFYR